MPAADAGAQLAAHFDRKQLSAAVPAALTSAASGRQILVRKTFNHMVKCFGFASPRIGSTPFAARGRLHRAPPAPSRRTLPISCTWPPIALMRSKRCGLFPDGPDVDAEDPARIDRGDSW